jgi:PIN domain nuclease of toxin-antitoxin system
VKGEFLLDASALLVLLRNEPGAETLLSPEPGGSILDRSVIHAVQLAEVVKKLVDAGVAEAACREWIAEIGIEVLQTLTADEAYHTARFCLKGLSLGDRICLSVASRNNLAAVTADHQWKELSCAKPELNLRVLTIR